MDRRKFIQNTALLGLGAGIAPGASLLTTKAKPSAIRMAFMSDFHAKPSATSERGMRKALRHVNRLRLGPQFIVNGGDAIMDGMAEDRTSTAEQWEVWNSVLRDENKLPIYHVIGNHDAWGWQLKDPTVKSDPMYNKAWAMKEYGMSERYYSFGKKHWNFIVLDSAQENNGGYIAKIDDVQFAWLEAQLNETPPDQFICIISHIPIVSFCAAMYADENQANGDWRISRALMHVDSRKLISLFEKYKNIKCCLSGHIHLVDAVEYKGIHYFCNGAVCGNWWNGPFKGFAPAYALFEFDKDGTVTREMVYY